MKPQASVCSADGATLWRFMNSATLYCPKCGLLESEMQNQGLVPVSSEVLRPPATLGRLQKLADLVARGATDGERGAAEAALSRALQGRAGANVRFEEEYHRPC